MLISTRISQRSLKDDDDGGRIQGGHCSEDLAVKSRHRFSPRTTMRLAISRVQFAGSCVYSSAGSSTLVDVNCGGAGNRLDASSLILLRASKFLLWNEDAPRL
jgi:hypothetical protein